MIDVDQCEYVPASHMGGAHGPTDLFVIHTAEFPELVGVAAERVAAFFHNTDKYASTQYTVDDDSAVRCVPEDRVCYGAGTPGGHPLQPNYTGQQFEISGYASQDDGEWDDPFSRATLVNLAAMCTQMIERRYPNIRPVHLDADALRRGERDGFTGHVDIETAAYPSPQRSDPGAAFPWDRFLAMVNHKPSAADLAAFYALLAELGEANDMKGTFIHAQGTNFPYALMTGVCRKSSGITPAVIDEMVDKGLVTNKRNAQGQVVYQELSAASWVALIDLDVAVLPKLAKLPS